MSTAAGHTSLTRLYQKVGGCPRRGEAFWATQFEWSDDQAKRYSPSSPVFAFGILPRSFCACAVSVSGSARNGNDRVTAPMTSSKCWESLLSQSQAVPLHRLVAPCWPTGLKGCRSTGRGGTLCSLRRAAYSMGLRGSIIGTQAPNAGGPPPGPGGAHLRAIGRTTNMSAAPCRVVC